MAEKGCDADPMGIVVLLGIVHLFMGGWFLIRGWGILFTYGGYSVLTGFIYILIGWIGLRQEKTNEVSYNG